MNLRSYFERGPLGRLANHVIVWTLIASMCEASARSRILNLWIYEVPALQQVTHPVPGKSAERANAVFEHRNSEGKAQGSLTQEPWVNRAAATTTRRDVDAEFAKLVVPPATTILRLSPGMQSRP